MWVGSWDVAGVPGRSFCWFIAFLQSLMKKKEKKKTCNLKLNFLENLALSCFAPQRTVHEAIVVDLVSPDAKAITQASRFTHQTQLYFGWAHAHPTHYDDRHV